MPSKQTAAKVESKKQAPAPAAKPPDKKNFGAYFDSNTSGNTLDVNRTNPALSRGRMLGY